MNIIVQPVIDEYGQVSPLVWLKHAITKFVVWHKHAITNSLSGTNMQSQNSFGVFLIAVWTGIWNGKWNGTMNVHSCSYRVVPKPRPAFHRLQYGSDGKLGGAWRRG